MRRPRARALMVAALCVALLPSPARGSPSLEAYRGLGAWIDIFDEAVYSDPEGTVAALAGHGVDTLFLQTATYRLRGPFFFPDLVGRFLDAAHARGIKVVAWYVPDFANLERDLSWSVAAIRYTSPSGERFDSFGLDIEVTAVRDPSERARRLLELSRQIRAAAGPEYPLGAITPSPLRSPGYWPVFPDEELAQIYDVYLPMAYWSYSSSGESQAYGYISRSADIVRSETGRPDLPIHMIGGLAGGADGAETRGFVNAVTDQRLMGASMYDVASSGPDVWAALRALRFPEPRQPTPPEPEAPRGLHLGSDLGTYGSIEGADRRFEEEVPFTASAMPGAWQLDVEVAGRVRVSANGERVATLAGDGWSARHTIELPDALLDDGGANTILFAGEGSWGVRRVTASGPPLPIDDGRPHGAIPASDPGRRDRVTYAFDAAAPMTVTVSGFDVAPGEVAVSLDGATIGWLPPGDPRVWSRPFTIVLEPSTPGPHRLTFDAAGHGEDPWAVRVEGSSPAAARA